MSKERLVNYELEDSNLSQFSLSETTARLALLKLNSSNTSRLNPVELTLSGGQNKTQLDVKYRWIDNG